MADRGFNVKVGGNQSYDYNPDKMMQTKLYLKVLGKIFFPIAMGAVALGIAVTEGVNLFSEKNEKVNDSSYRNRNNNNRNGYERKNK